MNSTIDIKAGLILGYAQSSCPITADVAAFPGEKDRRTLEKAHNLVRPARRLYIANGATLKKSEMYHTAVHYREQHPNDYGGVSGPAWLAVQLSHSSSNPEVLIVAPEKALPQVYMAVLRELIAHFDIRQFRDYNKLPKIIPCISDARRTKGLKFEDAGVSLKQLEAYFKAKGLGKT